MHSAVQEPIRAFIPPNKGLRVLIKLAIMISSESEQAVTEGAVASVLLCSLLHGRPTLPASCGPRLGFCQFHQEGVSANIVGTLALRAHTKLVSGPFGSDRSRRRHCNGSFSNWDTTPMFLGDAAIVMRATLLFPALRLVGLQIANGCRWMNCLLMRR